MLRLVGLYFSVQGVGIAIWWIVLLAAPGARLHFLPRGFPESALLAFGLADAVAAAACLVGGLLLARGSPRALGVICFASGCVVYGALYCVGALVLAGGPWAPSALMVPVALISVVLACRVSRG